MCNFLVDGLVFAVLIEGEDVIDVVDEWGDGYGFDGDVAFVLEVLVVLLDKEVFVVDQEAVEFADVFLFRHFYFYYWVIN